MARAATTPPPPPSRRSARGPLLLVGGFLVGVMLVVASLWQGGVLDRWLPGEAVAPTPGAASDTTAPGVDEAWRPARVDEAADGSGAGDGRDAPVVDGAEFPARGVDVQVEERAGTYYALVSAATLLIDGVEFGVTPLELEVPPGIYQLRLTKSGFDAVETEVNVEAGTTMRLRGRLPAR